MWLLFGILAAMLFNVVIPALGIPNPFDWIAKKVGG